MSSTQHPGWTLTREAFEGLLARLGPDRNAAAQEYERIRRKLVDFFDWRGSPHPEAHADETLDRLARKLEEGAGIDRVLSYAYGVARRVLLEWERRRAHEERALEAQWLTTAENASGLDKERHAACMERCLGELTEEGRALIVAYYKEAATCPLEGRKLLAQRLGLSYGTLKTRAHRTRVRLEECLRGCLRNEKCETDEGGEPL